MKSINIVECKNEDDLKEVAILAEKIWHEFFPGIISEAQIDYMVEQFQSFDAVQDQVKHQQYHYHKVYEGDELVGYIGLQNQPDRLFLSKLYLKDSARGKHYASEMVEYVKKQAEKYCYSAIYMQFKNTRDFSHAMNQMCRCQINKLIINDKYNDLIVYICYNIDEGKTYGSC